MNSAVRRFILFFFSIAALSACQDPKDIGIDLQDENLIGTTFTDTLSIETGTVLLPDSNLAFRQLPLVGQYADPALGSLRATQFTEMGISGANLSFAENAVADSLVLTLEYSGMYGNTNNNLTLSVHRLTQGFDDRVSYFTNSQLPYDNTALGTATFLPKMLKKKKEDADSTVAENKIRIKLNQAFADEILNRASFSSQENFVDFIKGLAIVPSGNPSKILYLNYAADTSKVTLYYKQSGSTETTRYTFRFNFSDVRYFNRVTGDRSGSAIAALQNKSDFIPASNTGNESYIQANTQLLTKIAIPHLTKIKEKEGNIIINRAELVLPIKSSSRTGYLTAPPQLVLYRTNNMNQILRNASGAALAVQSDGSNLQTGTAFPIVATIPAKKEQYTVNITSYIQAIMLGNVPNNELLLSAATISTGSQGQRVISVESVPYRTTITNTEAQPVKLILYYSKLN